MDSVAQIDLPDAAAALSRLPRLDYTDAFLVAADAHPETWARTALEGAPRERRLSLLAGWSSLGLRVWPIASANRVLGWPIASRDDRHLRLATSSILGMRGELVFMRTDDGMLLATLIELRNPIARRIWARMIPTHVAVVRSLLRRVAEPRPAVHR